MSDVQLSENGSAPDNGGSLLKSELFYAAYLSIAAAAALSFSGWQAGGVLRDNDLATAAFFLIYGLFTISVGFQHPSRGYYSFDRVAQVAGILVLGPVAAALINGLASLLYPWYRLWKQVPLRSVITASLHNAGLMTLIILISGSLYGTLGANNPLTDLTLTSVGALLVLVLSMQFCNDLGMFVLRYVRGERRFEFMSLFTEIWEISAATAGVLVAIVYNRMELEVIVLLLGVLALGMIILQKFANMRYKLELLVEERTRALHEKSLELERQATHDKLTGLYNRHYADHYLDQQLEHARRYHEPFSIAIADVDFFKQINDRHSHATGDEVLRRISDVLNARCRQTDIIARYGGEEFLLCFSNTDLEHAIQVCEEIRSAIMAEEWSRVGLSSMVTVSFGVAEFDRQSSRKSLLNSADQRLYAAKNSGRNRVVA